MTMADDALDRRAGDIKDAVDACIRALIDLDIEAKALALDQLAKLVATEEATHIAERH